METVGNLARRFELSRSTLLYYNRIGLLKPSGRSRSNYRLYSAADAERLSQICMYREAGVPLLEIKKILETGGATVEVLEQRLTELNDQISRFRQQQRVVLGLLKNRAKFSKTRAMDKRRWVEILRASGLNDEDMDRWHIEFERMSPEAHRDFMEALGIPPAEVKEIRRWCQKHIHPDG